MKKLLVVILLGLVILLTGCSEVSGEVNDIEGYVSVKSAHFDSKQIWVFNEESYVWYDVSLHGELIERQTKVYIYTPIDFIPFYQMTNREPVQLYETATYFYFVEAKDIHTLKLEG